MLHSGWVESCCRQRFMDIHGQVPALADVWKPGVVRRIALKAASGILIVIVEVFVAQRQPIDALRKASARRRARCTIRELDNLKNLLKNLALLWI